MNNQIISKGFYAKADPLFCLLNCCKPAT